MENRKAKSLQQTMMNEERTASEGGPYKAEGLESPGTRWFTRLVVVSRRRCHNFRLTVRGRRGILAEAGRRDTGHCSRGIYGDAR
jgi:hypothetical protein